MADITYCRNNLCPFLTCERHLEHAPKSGPVSVAWLDATCRLYIGWLVDQVEKEGKG